MRLGEMLPNQRNAAKSVYARKWQYLGVVPLAVVIYVDSAFFTAIGGEQPY